MFSVLQDQRGQTVVAAIFLIALALAVAAAALDAGLWLNARRQAQNAADGAALAGALEIRANPAMAETVAMEWAANNGYHDGLDGAWVTVDYPYRGDTERIEVVVGRPANLVLNGILKLAGFDISARAVARSQGSGSGYAIFAHGSTCNKDIDWTGSSVTTIGDVHTNGQFGMSGGSNYLDGTVTYGCNDKVTGTGNFYASGPAGGGQRDWPLWFDWHDFLPCTFYSSGDLSIGSGDRRYWLNDDPNTRTLKPGVYCAERKLSFSTGGTTGNVTFIAKGQVSVSGGTMNLSPYIHDVFIYSQAGGPNGLPAPGGVAVNISGSNGIWRGLIFAPYAEAQVSGGGNQVLRGSIVAKYVHISGSNWSLDGTGMAPAELISLIE